MIVNNATDNLKSLTTADVLKVGGYVNNPDYNICSNYESSAACSKIGCTWIPEKCEGYSSIMKPSCEGNGGRWMEGFCGGVVNTNLNKSAIDCCGGGGSASSILTPSNLAAARLMTKSKELDDKVVMVSRGYFRYKENTTAAEDEFSTDLVVVDRCSVYQSPDSCSDNECVWLLNESPTCVMAPSPEICGAVENPTSGKCAANGCDYEESGGEECGCEECESEKDCYEGDVVSSCVVYHSYFTETYCNAITEQNDCKVNCRWNAANCIGQAACGNYTVFDDCIADGSNVCFWIPSCVLLRQSDVEYGTT